MGCCESTNVPSSSHPAPHYGGGATRAQKEEESSDDERTPLTDADRLRLQNFQLTWLQQQKIFTDSIEDMAELFKSDKEGLLKKLLQFPIVDILIDTLMLDANALPEDCRQSILLLFHEILSKFNDALLHFNGTSNVGGVTRTRLDRIKVLLYHLNEELCPVDEIFEVIQYRSVMFEKILAQLPLRYTLILDKSGSMLSKDGSGQTRWKTASDATEHMAEQVERLVSTEHGMTLLMFSSRPFSKYTGLKTCEEVEEAFAKESPSGTTDLSGALEDAFKDHQAHGEYEHILVVTDGAPNNKTRVHEVLVSGINALKDANELGLTFMQVGDDHSAAEFLHELQDHLVDQGAKYAVVDALTHKDYCGKTLCDVIHQYLPEPEGHED